MSMKVKSLISAGLLGVFWLMLPNAARADDFTCSFTTAAGTVTGEIFGLTNCSVSCSATDVTIASVPANLNTDLNLSSPTTDTFTAPWSGSTGSNNTFTEIGGSITSAYFQAGGSTTNSGTLDHLTLYLAYNTNLGSNFSYVDQSLFTTTPFAFLSETTDTQVDSQSIAFSPVSAAAPEPSSLSLMLMGLLAFAMFAAV